MIRSSAADEDDNDDSNDGGGSSSAVEQKIGFKMTRPNQGSLLIDATCVPSELRHPTDLSLLNEGRELTEALLDAMQSQIRESFSHKPRTHRKKAR